jgi:hypothetical protein
MKKTQLWAIALVIAGLMITTTAVSITPTEKPLENDTGDIVENISVASLGTVSREQLAPMSFSKAAKPLVGPDVPVFITEETSQNPAMDTDGFGDILVFDEDVVDATNMKLIGRWSTDFGATWSEEMTGWELPNANTKPRLDYYGLGKTAWGTIVPGSDISGYIYYIGLPDMTDPTVTDANNPDGWSLWYADWSSNGYSEVDSADVACYSNTSNIPSPEFWGIVALNCDVEGTETEDNTMVFSYFTSGGQIQSIYFYNMLQDLRKMTTDIDQVTGRFFMCMEYYNHATKPDGTIIYYKSISTNPDWWKTGWNSRYFTNLLNPDIAAGNKQVYIVGEEQIVNGTKAIVCQHSANGGTSFTKTTVFYNATIDTQFPRVSMVRLFTGNYAVICSYTRDGNLYASISIDGGVTWVETDAVNDVDGSAVEQYSGQCVGGPYIVWTDEREPPTDIYFDTVFDLPPPPILEITEIKGIVGVTATIANTGEAAAHNVSWNIKVTGGMFGKINKDVSDIIPVLAAGAEQSVSTGIIIGLGAVQITATATCDEGSYATGSASGTNLIFLTLVKSS